MEYLALGLFLLFVGILVGWFAGRRGGGNAPGRSPDGEGSGQNQGSGTYYEISDSCHRFSFSVDGRLLAQTFPSPFIQGDYEITDTKVYGIPRGHQGRLEYFYLDGVSASPLVNKKSLQSLKSGDSTSDFNGLVGAINHPEKRNHTIGWELQLSTGATELLHSESVVQVCLDLRRVAL